jgi:hypothetical protein
MLSKSKAFGATLLLLALALVAVSGYRYGLNVTLNDTHSQHSSSNSIVPTNASIRSTIPATTPQQYSRSEVLIGGLKIYADLADTPKKQINGLVWRSQLNDSEGMLFVFSSERSLNFWMKNMLIPIDIVFVTSDMKVINVYKSVPPCVDDPCKLYASSKPAKYALELSAGFCERHGVHPGDSISLSISGP